MDLVAVVVVVVELAVQCTGQQLGVAVVTERMGLELVAVVAAAILDKAI